MSTYVESCIGSAGGINQCILGCYNNAAFCNHIGQDKNVVIASEMRTVFVNASVSGGPFPPGSTNQWKVFENFDGLCCMNLTEERQLSA